MFVPYFFVNLFHHSAVQFYVNVGILQLVAHAQPRSIAVLVDHGNSHDLEACLRAQLAGLLPAPARAQRLGVFLLVALRDAHERALRVQRGGHHIAHVVFDEGRDEHVDYGELAARGQGLVDASKRLQGVGQVVDHVLAKHPLKPRTPIIWHLFGQNDLTEKKALRNVYK